MDNIKQTDSQEAKKIENPQINSQYYFYTSGSLFYPYSYVHPSIVTGNSSTLDSLPAPPPSSAPLPGGIPPWRITKSSQNNQINQRQIKPGIPSTNSSRSSQEKVDKGKWPPSLKSYVERCFSSCKTDFERDKMENLLREKISSVIQIGDLSRINWANELVPGTIVYQPKPIATEKNSNENKDKHKKEARAKRFCTDSADNATKKRAYDCTGELSSEGLVLSGSIVGRSTELEKPYLRLTSAPDPLNVRPLPILKKSLDFLVSKWLANHDYSYMCDQLKSIRQDLTVQGILNSFTVRVYELHARLALEEGDFGEYNQCHSQLRVLYAMGIEGNECEFVAFRILYLILTGNTLDINNLLLDINQSFLESDYIRNALDILVSNHNNDFNAYFSKIREIGSSSDGLLKKIDHSNQRLAIQIMIKAYRPTISLNLLKQLIKFIGSDVSFIDFLKSENIVFATDLKTIDCKSSLTV